MLVRETPEAPRIVQDLPILLDCPPELDGNIPMLKTPHTLDALMEKSSWI